MSQKDLKTLLKKWMSDNDKSTTDVASMTRVSITTVQRILKGHEPSTLVSEILKKLVTPDNHHS